MSEEKNQKVADYKIKKLGIMLVMLLILLIPTAFMFGVIDDRENYKREATRAVASAWAGEQILEAPSMSFDVKTAKEIQTKNLTLNKYNVDVKIQTEIRKKGIFKIPVYTADVTLKGDFENTFGNIANKNITTVFSLKDSTGFISDPVFKINNSKEQTVQETKYTTKLASSPKIIPFEIKYKVRGLNEIFVSPLGKSNSISISGNWKDPSFEGNFLPVEKNITKDSFSAKWSIPGIATTNIKSAKAGVSLLVPIDNYRMASRTLKYAVLFLFLTFLSYFVFEISSKEKRKIHPFQYCLLGGAMLIFYLLLVSLSEFLPFVIAYTVSAFMIISLICSYTYFVITKRTNKSFTYLMALLLTILYAFLYAILLLQDFALLIGSFVLFVIIAIIMFVTRNVDWYSEK